MSLSCNECSKSTMTEDTIRQIKTPTYICNWMSRHTDFGFHGLTFQMNFQRISVRPVNETSTKRRVLTHAHCLLNKKIK